MFGSILESKPIGLFGFKIFDFRFLIGGVRPRGSSALQSEPVIGSWRACRATLRGERATYGSAHLWRFHLFAAGKVGAGDARGRTQHSVEVALKNDLAAAGTRFGTDFNHVVGGANHGLVVFDHDHGVARIGERADDANQPVQIARVQADRGFVEHEQRVDQRGAETRGEINPLDLAAGECAGGAIQRQVAEPDLFKVTQPGDNGVVGEIALVVGGGILAG